MTRPPPDREPTSAECSDNAIVDGCLAAWYPQMGGYGGKCWIVSADNDADGGGPCFDVAVYHDGEFPFCSESPFETASPVILHHCSADQFIRFGRICDAFLGDKPGDGD